MKGFIKDPDATLDYAFDWGPWLDGDVIENSVWTADAGITIVPASDSISADQTITTVFISGGTAGQNYNLKNTVTTQAARTDERTVAIKVRNR